MRVRIGNWGTYGFAIEFQKQDAAQLLNSYGREYTISFDDRLVIISAGGNHSLIGFGNRNRPGFTHILSTRRIDDPAPFPHFELMDAELSVEGDGEDWYLAGELEPDHELPWPSRKSVKAIKCPEELAQFCEDEVQARMNSAVASGQSTFKHAIPAHIRDNAEKGLFLRCREAANQLSGIL